jgi:predicted extracellular nuclease
MILQSRSLNVRSFSLLPTLTLILVAATRPVAAADVVITGVVDGPLTGGVPKAIELCVVNNVADLSIYGVGSANNGGGSDGEEFTFPAGPASAGTFLHVASEATGFSDFFGFSPNYTSGAAAINGDDAIELFMSGGVVDVFGDIDVDGSGEAWEYLDGWAYRNDGTGPDGSTFAIGNWSFSGPNALDGETTNGTATTPFPIGSYSSCELSAPAPELLLSEVVVTPTAGEFIEIHNPTGSAIDLSDVYLTDATFAGGGTYYYNIVTGANAGGGGFSDFHARFPDGATIAAGEFQTISLAGSDDFFTTYGFDPTYELYEDGVGADAVADMREALPGSINNQGGLSNSGEVVILYTWDGASDLVQDIDYALWGDAAEAVDKTGVSIDGPDGDAVASAYLADTAIGVQEVISGGSHASGDSFQRIDFNEGVETQVGGNGITGSDETSEDLSVTWSLAAATPGAGPTPPPAVAVIINEIIQNPSAVSDNNGEWFELYNATPDPVDINGWTIKDNGSNNHVIANGGPLEIPAGSYLVLGRNDNPGSNGGVAVDYQYSNVFLGNGSDALILLNTGDVEVDRVEWDNGATFPDPNGASMALKFPSLDNNAGVNWCESQTPFGDGDLGTPGAANDCLAKLVINEVDADQTSTDDGEFIEIYDGGAGSTDLSGLVVVLYNGSDDASYGSAIDLDGFSTDADGFFVICGDAANVPACDLDVSPDTNLIQNGADAVTLRLGDATDFPNDTPVTTIGLLDAIVYDTNDSDDAGLLVLLNAGQPQVNEGGAGNKDLHSNQRCPNGFGGQRNTDTYLQTTPSAGALNNCPPIEIFNIQGAGLASPYAGFIVNMTGGVVTALAPDGFFVQMPIGDGDPDTSDGIFIFTGSPPTVSVGDIVDVTGTVQEFFGLTEISTSAAMITVVGSGALPAVVEFNADVPSPDPTAPSCAIEYECYEGMLVSIPNGIVAASNQEFGTDPFAEVHVTAGDTRPFREPGIEYPGLVGLRVWDGNPEVFELDADKLIDPPFDHIPARSTFSATGILGFEFNHYEFWPTSLTVDFAPLPVAVRPAGAYEVTVGSLNVFRLFENDDAFRLAKFSAYIVDVMRSPDILAIQEVESLAVLQNLAAAVNAQDGSVNYTAYLVEGNDIGGIDVGFLVRDDVQVSAVTQLGATELFTFDTPASLLHDRPPLLLEGTVKETFPISVMVLHMRSLNGIETERTQRKRFEQAISVAQKVQDIQTANPNVYLVVIGDFNAFEFTDGYVDLAGIIKGNYDPAQSLVCTTVVCADLVTPDLRDEVLHVSPDERYSFIFRDSFNPEGSRGDAQILDHAMTSQGLDGLVTGLEFARGNADAAEELVEDDGTLDELALRSSDHDGLVLYIFRDEDKDGVSDDLDVCPATSLPEAVPTVSLGTNRFADTDGDGVFNTTPSNGKGPGRSYDIHDTAGCSCEQIIDEQGLGNGHTKFGCSIGAMDNWVKLVQ